jgi:hypothetical protein
MNFKPVVALLVKEDQCRRAAGSDAKTNAGKPIGGVVQRQAGRILGRR